MTRSTVGRVAQIFGFEALAITLGLGLTLLLLSPSSSDAIELGVYLALSALLSFVAVEVLIGSGLLGRRMRLKTQDHTGCGRRRRARVPECVCHVGTDVRQYSPRSADADGNPCICSRDSRVYRRSVVVGHLWIGVGSCRPRQTPFRG